MVYNKLFLEPLRPITSTEKIYSASRGIFRAKFASYAFVSNRTVDLTLARTLHYHSVYDMLCV
jgi:hypothetical protein